ncbi:MAG: hypothetical protein HWE25_16315 [Alphaproteobacteria bacterium]|nr:hypothetical protein [Alphaproteobacteria bacterium]
MLEKISSQFSKDALLRAPLVPSALFTVIAVVFSGLVIAAFPIFPADLLLFAPAAFVGWYVFGLVATLVLGGVLIPMLPDEIPVISALNQSRFGRIFLAFIFLGVIASGMLGMSGWTSIFILMCLGEYTGHLPHKQEKQPKKKGLFV